MTIETYHWERKHQSDPPVSVSIHDASCRVHVARPVDPRWGCSCVASFKLSPELIADLRAQVLDIDVAKHAKLDLTGLRTY